MAPTVWRWLSLLVLLDGDVAGSGDTRLSGGEPRPPGLEELTRLAPVVHVSNGTRLNRAKGCSSGTSLYAGWPNGMGAMTVAKRVFSADR